MLFFFVLRWNFINICSTFTHSYTIFFRVVLGKCKCWDGVLFLFLGIDIQVINCFWKIWVALRRDNLVRLVQANLLIWADSAGWTGWEVLTVLDEWKMALVTVLVEVERVKMAVVCQSAGIVVHME